MTLFIREFIKYYNQITLLIKMVSKGTIKTIIHLLSDGYQAWPYNIISLDLSPWIDDMSHVFQHLVLTCILEIQSRRKSPPRDGTKRIRHFG